MFLLSLLNLYIRKVQAQQNDFRARSLEDSWGHQAMRINRWSVMHRVWDGLYDLKNVKKDNEWSTIDNSGKERTSDSPLAKEIEEQYEELLDAEARRLNGLDQLLDEQKHFNENMNQALKEVGDIANEDRKIYNDLIKSLTADQQLLSKSLAEQIIRNYEEINELKFKDAEFMTELELTRFESTKGDLEVLTKCSNVEKDYLQSRATEADELLNLYSDFLSKDSERRESIDDLKAQLAYDANQRKEARDRTWNEYREMREAFRKEIEALREHNVQRESILDAQLKMAETQQLLKIESEFLEKMDEIQKNYDRDHVKYLVEIEKSMRKVKFNVNESKKRKLMLLQEDKRQIIENLEVSARLVKAGFHRDSKTGTWSSAQSLHSMMTYSQLLITFVLPITLIII